MSTAEQLVNRVRRKMREDDISAATDDLSVAILDEINTAKVDILESRIWEFDKRSTAFITQPIGTTSDITLFQAVNAIGCTWDSVTSVTFAGDYSWYVVVTDAANHPDTAFRLTGGTLTGSTFVGVLDTVWPDAGFFESASGYFFVPEYQFPLHSDDGESTVRQLLSMKHQERDLDLRQISRREFDELIVSPQYSYGQDPIVVYTGFDVAETGTQASPGTDYAPGFAIWPVPTSPTRLDYHYVYSHPAITTTQDLENVPRVVEDQISWMAYARIKQSGIGNEVSEGIALEAKLWSRLDDIHRGQKRDPQRRIVVRPHDHRTLSDPANFGVIPHDVGSL